MDTFINTLGISFRTGASSTSSSLRSSASCFASCLTNGAISIADAVSPKARFSRVSSDEPFTVSLVLDLLLPSIPGLSVSSELFGDVEEYTPLLSNIGGGGTSAAVDIDAGIGIGTVAGIDIGPGGVDALRALLLPYETC